MLYDPYSDRWIAVAVCNRTASNAGALIAASATSDPTGTWYQYNFGVDANGLNWADFPLVGFNRDKVVASWAYIQTATGSLNGSAIVVFDKATLYAGNSFTSGTTLTFINVAASSGYHFMPVATYDTNQAALYIVQASSSTRLAVYSVTGSSGSAAFTFRGNATGPAWHRGGQLNFARQLGTSQQINLVDDRIGSQAIYREGSLWCSHTVWLPSSNPTRSAIQWWQLNTSGASIQRGYIEDTTSKTNYAFPSIAVNKFKDVLIGFSSFATNQYPSANYAFRPCNLGSGLFLAPALLKAGVSPFWKSDGSGRNRWGDYSASQVDPLNDTDLWTIQEYAASTLGL